MDKSYLKSLPLLEALLPDLLPPLKISSPKKSSKISEKEDPKSKFPNPWPLPPSKAACPN